MAEMGRLSAALHIYPIKDAVRDYNHNSLRDLDTPVIRVEAITSGHTDAKKAPSDIAANLAPSLELAIGARMMLLQNV